MIYVVSLQGKSVFHDFSIQCAMKDLSDLKLLRARLKEKHNLTFDEHSSARASSSSYLVFDNIGDDRDVKLVVEKTYFV